MRQRTLVVLLLLMGVGVWGLLLRPAVTPVPVLAQDGGSSGSRLVSTGTGLYHYSPNGYIDRFSADLTLLDRAIPTLRASATPWGKHGQLHCCA
jgi:hypothetical protein